MRNNTLKFCDLSCEYAKWPDKLADGSKTCHTFIALFCTKLNRLVDKNGICMVNDENDSIKDTENRENR